MPVDPQLITQLRSPDPEQRKAAILALGRAGDTDALPVLANQYRNDPDPALRELALKAGRHIKGQGQTPLPPAAITTIPSATIPPPANLSRSILQADQDAKWHYDRALDYHVRGNPAKAASELGIVLQSNPQAANDPTVRLLAGEITGQPPDEALETLTHSNTRRQFEKAQPRVRKPPRRGRLSVLLLMVALVTLAGAVVFFVSSGALDRYRQADKLNAMRQTVHQSNGLDYYLFVPAGEPPPKGWPALLALHGYGGSGMDVFPLFADLAARDHVVLIAPTFGNYPGAAEQTVAPQLDKLLANVDREYPLNAFGAVVYGFSAGGEAATLFANMYPGRVAGVTVEATPEIYPPPPSRGLPYNIIYGENDDVRSYATASVNNLQRLGYPLNYVVVPGAGHQITPTGLELAMDMVRTVYP